MRVLILGVGDAFTTRSFGTSALLEAPNGYLLIDCPDPIHRVLTEAASGSGWPISAENIDNIVITHLHGDHCNGIESFGFARYYLHPDAPKPMVHTNRPSAARLWERLAPAMDGATTNNPPRTIDDFFQLRVIEPDTPSEIAGLRVECRFTGHPIPTTSLRISDGDRTLGWSSDTPFDQGLIDWLAPADLIIHESNNGVAHTPIEKLNTLPSELQDKMRLIHLPDDFDKSSTALTALVQGEVLEF